MNKLYSLTIGFILTTIFVFGQASTNRDTSQFTIRKGGEHYVDGFNVYTKLTKADSSNILIDLVSKINGCWTSDGQIHSFNLSNKTFSGTWYTKGINSTAPLVRLEFLNGQVKLIVTDLIGSDGTPRNIRVIDEKKIIVIEYPDNKCTFRYTAMEKCP